VCVGACITRPLLLLWLLLLLLGLGLGLLLLLGLYPCLLLLLLLGLCLGLLLGSHLGVFLAHQIESFVLMRDLGIRSLVAVAVAACTLSAGHAIRAAHALLHGTAT
jgi:hypothetical protein